MAFPSSALLPEDNGRCETNVSRLPRVLTSHPKQRIKRRQVAWDERRRHCSHEQLLPATLAQRQIQTRSWKARSFSLTMARDMRGGLNEAPDLLEV